MKGGDDRQILMTYRTAAPECRKLFQVFAHTSLLEPS